MPSAYLHRNHIYRFQFLRFVLILTKIIRNFYRYGTSFGIYEFINYGLYMFNSASGRQTNAERESRVIANSSVEVFLMKILKYRLKLV